jgi:hypothetical protein
LNNDLDSEGGANYPMANMIKEKLKTLTRTFETTPVVTGFRSCVAMAGRSGELVKFAIRGRPGPETTIILAGSGRSGTTWVMDMLSSDTGIQPIYEPLNPVWIPEVRRITDWNRERLLPRSFYLRPGVNNPAWKDFLFRVLTGQVRCGWTDVQRVSFFPNKFLVKFVRANLMLGFIYDEFHSKIVLVLRHPCAVVHSRLASGWHGNVEDILNQEELVEDHLHPWVSDIEKEKDYLGANAVWWAVETMVGIKQLSERPHHRAYYETLCVDPENYFPGIFSFLGIKEDLTIQDRVLHPSRSSRSKRATNDERLYAWMSDLSKEDQKRILDWANRLGIDDYSGSALPVRI